MTDILATLFRFRQFVFEFGPFFLAAWLGLAVATGLITAAQGKGIDIRMPSSPFSKTKLRRGIWRLLFLLLWRPGGKAPALPTFSGLLFFSLVTSIPALVATSLIGMDVVLLRLILTALFVLLLSWLFTSVLLPKDSNPEGQQPETETTLPSPLLNNNNTASQTRGPGSFVRTSWKSFVGQLEGALIPIIIGISLASVLTIYVPAYVVRPWLSDSIWQGPYLASLLTIPFQLVGGGEVFLASALLVKGASLGTALSVMLVAPGTTFAVIRHLYRPVRGRTIVLHLVATWLVAGSMGVAVDLIQRLFSL